MPLVLLFKDEHKPQIWGSIPPSSANPTSQTSMEISPTVPASPTQIWADSQRSGQMGKGKLVGVWVGEILEVEASKTAIRLKRDL